MEERIAHDPGHDGVDRRGFLKCMAWAGTGMNAEFTVRPVPDTPWLQLWASGTVAATTFGRELNVRADRSMELGGPKGVRPVGPTIAIELPDQRAAEWQHVVTVPDGRACLLSAVSDTHHPGKVLVLIAEARRHDITMD